MSREYRDLLTKAAPAHDLEEKRGLNTRPGSSAWSSSIHSPARRGGGLMPKGKGARKRLAKRANSISKANSTRAASFAFTRQGVNLKRPQRGAWTSGAQQAASLTRSINHHNNRAYRTAAVGARLNRGAKVRF